MMVLASSCCNSGLSSELNYGTCVMHIWLMLLAITSLLMLLLWRNCICLVSCLLHLYLNLLGRCTSNTSAACLFFSRLLLVNGFGGHHVLKAFVSLFLLAASLQLLFSPSSPATFESPMGWGPSRFFGWM